jgi:hypothetical protein
MASHGRRRVLAEADITPAIISPTRPFYVELRQETETFERRAGSFSKAPLALLESPQRPHEIDSSKSRPKHVCEIELAEHALP